MKTVYGAPGPKAKGRPAAKPGRPVPWWARLGLWRALAFAGFALALALAITMLTPRSERPFESVVVVLAAPDGKAGFVATAERGSRYLTVKALEPVEVPRDRVLELWMMPDGKRPLSLGFAPASGVARLAVRSPVGIALQSIPMLAISVEPMGGSPAGTPSGRVLYTGRVERIW